MIVNDLHIAGRAVSPLEDHAPLLVDPDRVEALQATLQGFESIAWWYSQILQLTCCVQVLELTLRRSPEVGRELARSGRIYVTEQFFGQPISKRLDHLNTMLS
jgi:hypothetical protein